MIWRNIWSAYVEEFDWTVFVHGSLAWWADPFSSWDKTYLSRIASLLRSNPPLHAINTLYEVVNLVKLSKKILGW